MSSPQDPNAPQNPPAGGYPGQGGHPDQSQGYPSQGYPDQQNYPQQGYGDQTATPTSGAHHGTPKIGRPGVMVAAVVLWVLAGLAAGFVGFGVAVGGGDPAVREQLNDALSQGQVPGVDAAGIQQALVIFGIVVLVLAALMIVLPLLMLGRQSWARILVTIVGVLALLPLIATFIGPILVIVAIVLQFLPATNAWFRAPRSAV